MSTRRGKALVTGGPAHRTKGDTDANRSDMRQRAYDLRIRGRTLRQIGEDLGCSHTKVHELLREEIKLREDPLIEATRQFECDRLDGYLQACLHVLDHPGREVVDLVTGITHVIVDDRKILGAIDRLIKISETKRRLLGIDAPVKVHMDVVETDQQDLELQELIRDAQARAAVAADKIRNGGTS
jgi:hypothetical protein